MKPFLFPACLVVLLSGCSLMRPVVDTSVRYLLEPALPEASPLAASPAVAIALPSLPPYLDRLELVTRSGDGQLDVLEDHLWGEPLDGGIARVVAANLRRLTGSANIQPSASFISRDYSALVEIRIERFDPTPDGSLVLACTWKLQPVDGAAAAPVAFHAAVPMDGGGSEGAGPMSGRLAAMNEALARLSQAIAAAF